MSAGDDLASGKGHRDENFPVASFIIAPRHRAVVMAFYRVARMADDIADHPSAPPTEKLARLAAIDATLRGDSDAVPEAVALREAQARRGLTGAHALDLLEAFRRDVTKTRYDDWADLMDYCRYSAAPVGRFVLDVPGEDRAAWPASGALCGALQVINHLQDCREDYLALDRVYIPLDLMRVAGAPVECLGEETARPMLRTVIALLAVNTQALLKQSRPLAGQVKDARVSLEVGVIQALAESLDRRLIRRDPFSRAVRHGRWEMAAFAALGAARGALARGPRAA